MNKHKDFTRIRLLAMDMDGVLTDGGIYILSNGEQARKFHAQDGEGIQRLSRSGVQVGIITGSKENDIIYTRTQMLGLDNNWIAVNTSDKLAKLSEWLVRESITWDQVAYIGDDVPDIDVMLAVGISACPSDAVFSVRDHADMVLTRKGGEGCVREFIDMILTSRID